MSISNPFSRFVLFVPFTLAFLALGLAAFLLRATPPSTTISSVQVAEARLGPGTEALTRQIALHVSKMTGGESVGGFPPFRPPEDDEQYKEKVQDRTYSSEEANYWVKELNNFLNQIAAKNPNLSLREILLRQGLSQTQASSFLAKLQEVNFTVEGLKGYGITVETVEAFQSVLIKLGVPL